MFSGKYREWIWGDSAEEGRKTGGKEIRYYSQLYYSCLEIWLSEPDNGDGDGENGKNREIFKKLTKNWQNFVTVLIMDSEGEVNV